MVQNQKLNIKLFHQNSNVFLKHIFFVHFLRKVLSIFILIMLQAQSAIHFF